MNDRSRNHTSISRRRFGKMAGATIGAAAGFYFIPSRAWGRLEKLALAGIGTGGKGRSDIRQSENVGFEVVALVDIVDAKKLDSAKGRLKGAAGTRGHYPDAAFFTDYRQMLGEMGDKVDAVTVSTPDHHHFHASVLAMQQGKHVYCQKPLTHGIWEARMLAQLAKRNGVKTQMGNQAHANNHMRRCVELIRAGIVGKVKEVHAWTNRPIWPQGFKTPPAQEPVPPAIDWDQWIGPAPWVDYSPRIAPFSWRGWWDYGTGALGDMACHIMDMGYWAMDTNAPTGVIAEQSGATDISPPINSKITWEFPAGKYSSKDGFKYCWYDGYVDAHFERDGWKLVKESNEYNHPGEDVLDGMDFRKYGSVVIGEKGKLFYHRGRGWVVKPDSLTNDLQEPEPSIPRAANQNPYQEWVDAIQGKVAEGQSNFQYAASLTETILIGVVAQRVPDTKLEWDAEKMEVKGRPELKQYIQRPYRDGWQLKV
ncbi:MAG: Gfo/Idh/MocA family oxidoreductase [Pirellulaceae bacterium]